MIDEKYTYDQPTSYGVRNAICRAHQLLDTRWAPLMEFHKTERGFITSARNGKHHITPESYNGIPYSSTRILDKFVGLDITFDTFLSALKNPASILYTTDLSDFEEDAYHCAIRNTFLVYGTVCSAFVDYSLDLPIHRSTHEWGTAPEFFKISAQSADSLSLCDTLVTTRPDGSTGGHVRLVTGLARDGEGRVKQVEISEGWEPFPISNWYTAEEFNATLTESNKMYQIFRYKHLEQVRPAPELQNSDNSSLMLNYGNYANYRTTEPITFNINCDADTLMIEGDNQRQSIALSDLKPTILYESPHKLLTVTLPAGRYKAYCVKNSSAEPPVHFIVVKTPDITLHRNDGTPFKRIALKPVAPDGTPLTKDSPCFYAEDGTLRTDAITIALSDGTQLIPARAAVRMHNGTMVMRMAAQFTDVNGDPIHVIPVDSEITLYALTAKNNDTVHVCFSNAEYCTPSILTWKEEAAIAYSQRLITEDERLQGKLITKVTIHDNRFAQVMIASSNELGKINSKSFTFVIM